MKSEYLIVIVCLTTLYCKADWFRVTEGVAEWCYATPSSDVSEWHECEDSCITNGILALPSEVAGHQIAYIFKNAFIGLEAISKIVLPAELEWIDSHAMIYCHSLKELVISPMNKKFCSVGGVLYNKNMSRLVAFPQAKDDDVFVMPESVTEISDYAFYNNSLGGIQFGHNITEVGFAAFMKSRRLAEIFLYGRIEHIGARAFGRCEKLTSVTCNECEFTLGISDFCFFDCSSLQFVVLPESLKYIGSGAFRHCKSLERISLPRLGIGVPSDAFDGCLALQMITVTEKSAKYYSVDGVLYDGEANRIVRCPEGFSNSKKLYIQCGVEEIGPGAFAGCRGLKSICIPKTVVRICNGAFCGCCADIELIFEGEMPAGLDKSGLPKGCRIYADVKLPKWSKFLSQSIFKINVISKSDRNTK